MMNGAGPLHGAILTHAGLPPHTTDRVATEPGSAGLRQTMGLMHGWNSRASYRGSLWTSRAPAETEAFSIAMSKPLLADS
jgi:hypothetical protein